MHCQPPDMNLVADRLVQLIGPLILLFGCFVVYRVLSTFDYQLRLRMSYGLRMERCVKQKVLSCIKKSESSRSARQSNLAHAVPHICYLLIEAFDELERHPEIYEDTKFYDFATVYLMFRAHRISFMEISCEKRVAWLKEHYNRYIIGGRPKRH